MALAKNHYRFRVESVAQPTLDELQAAYDLCDEKWADAQSVKFHESLVGLTPTTGEKIAFLFKVTEDEYSDLIVEWAEKNGYRLAFPCEREAFTKAYPDIQRRRKHKRGTVIVDLGSYLESMHGRSYPMLGEDAGDRFLFGTEGDEAWDSDDRFLLIQK